MLTPDLAAGLGAYIQSEFQRWGLTTAERAVALLMLKGLRHKDIAHVRNTSTRTVRQQAHTIYLKAGFEGRTDLAAYFLEDVLALSLLLTRGPARESDRTRASSTASCGHFVRVPQP